MNFHRWVVSVTHDFPGDPEHNGCRVYWAIDRKLFIVGIAHVGFHWGKVRVSDLAVDPIVRLHGVGRMIVEKIQRDYPTKPIHGIAATPAIDFWKAVGAVMGENQKFKIAPRVREPKR